MMYGNNPLRRNGTWWESVLGHTLVYCILQIMFSTNINAILKGCCFVFFYLSIVVEQAMDLPSVNVLFYLCFIPNSWVTMCNTNTITLIYQREHPMQLQLTSFLTRKSISCCLSRGTESLYPEPVYKYSSMHIMSDKVTPVDHSVTLTFILKTGDFVLYDTSFA